jgi:hypothetical protein
MNMLKIKIVSSVQTRTMDINMNATYACIHANFQYSPMYLNVTGNNSTTHYLMLLRNTQTIQ